MCIIAISVRSKQNLTWNSSRALLSPTCLQNSLDETCTFFFYKHQAQIWKKISITKAQILSHDELKNEENQS